MVQCRHGGSCYDSIGIRKLLIRWRTTCTGTPQIAPGGEQIIAPTPNYHVDRKEDDAAWDNMANLQTRTHPGFSISDGQVARGGLLRHRITWRGGSLGVLAGRPLRLRFEMRRTTVHALLIG